ncbi:MAG: M20 family metallopeptidase [Synergistaceae bacterium]|nr:M20 family metallopeptidase [Synergistaceae bacterium]
MITFCKEKFLSDLETIVNIDSMSSSINGIQKMMDFFTEKYKSIGMDVFNFNSGSKCGAGLEVRNYAAGNADVLFVGHMDTVFPDGTASQRPFRIDGNIAYGPGVADMKSGLLLIHNIVEALLAQDSDIKICVAMNSDEEIGSPASSAWLKELGMKTRYCFVFEPGRANGEFVNKRKGASELLVKFYGVSGHAGMHYGNEKNAILEAANWILMLSKQNDPSTGTSVNAGIIKGGTASNIIADYAECVFDIRYEVPDELAKLHEIVNSFQKKSFVRGAHAEVSWLTNTPPYNISEKTAKLMQGLEKCGIELDIPVRFIATGGSSDANNIAASGVPIIDACGPSGGDLHSDKEFMCIDSIKDRFDLFCQFIKTLSRFH